MSEPMLENLNPAASKRAKPFLDEILDKFNSGIHSIHVTGTAVTDDFDEKVSDVNSVVVLREMDLGFLEKIAPLGKKYGKSRIAAPLVMTPDYIHSSLDVFPVEFLSFKLVHSTVFGDDVFADLAINRMDLRNQCERDLKTKLIWLRQGYISSQGNKKILTQGFVDSITEYIPLFRGIIVLFNREAPVIHSDVINVLNEATGIDTGIYKKVLKEKHQKSRLSIEELNTIFEDYYAATDRLREIVDEVNE